MPPLTQLALRYLIWFIALRLLFGLLQSFAGMPAAAATGVILAAGPMADIGLQAVRRATRVLQLADWARIWAVCFGTYLMLEVVLPAVFISPMRAALAAPGGAAQLGLSVFATAVMGALFLWIGARSGTGPGR